MRAKAVSVTADLLCNGYDWRLSYPSAAPIRPVRYKLTHTDTQRHSPDIAGERCRRRMPPSRKSGDNRNPTRNHAHDTPEPDTPALHAGPVLASLVRGHQGCAPPPPQSVAAARRPEDAWPATGRPDGRAQPARTDAASGCRRAV